MVNKFETSSFILLFDFRVFFLVFLGTYAVRSLSSIDFSEFNVFILAFEVALFAPAYNTLIKYYL